MNRVIDILMRRDGDSRDEARARVIECREQISASDIFEADDIMADLFNL